MLPYAKATHRLSFQCRTRLQEPYLLFLWPSALGAPLCDVPSSIADRFIPCIEQRCQTRSLECECFIPLVLSNGARPALSNANASPNHCNLKHSSTDPALYQVCASLLPLRKITNSNYTVDYVFIFRS